MRGKRITKIAVLTIAIIFGLGATLALAASQWCLDKDKRDRCSVRECKAATKTTIAGPFATKQEAMKAKEDKCGKPATKPKAETKPKPETKPETKPPK